jgi:SAM-dependent methyltransferase
VGTAAGTSAPLTLTGERTLPGIAEENYWFRRHEAAYLALAPFCTGAVVLEAGCGEGYGAALLAGRASWVIALDYLPGVVSHVRSAYGGLPAVQGDLQRLPLATASVEVVAALQVVEHLHHQPGFVAECARVLRPAGTLLVTTPNRLTFSPGGGAPVNPFHTRELSPAELTELLAPAFSVTRLLGLRHGRRITRWEKRNGGLVKAQLAAAPVQWAPALRRFVAGITARDFVVAPHHVDDSLDLLAVAVRRA